MALWRGRSFQRPLSARCFSCIGLRGVCATVESGRHAGDVEFVTSPIMPWPEPRLIGQANLNFYGLCRSDEYRLQNRVFAPKG